MQLFNFQEKALKETEKKNKVAYYLSMGLGKTFVGSEKLHRLNNQVNLVICQKSKVKDWLNHFDVFYPEYSIFDLTTKKDYSLFIEKLTYGTNEKLLAVINYELCFRKHDLLDLTDFTLMLDESSLIQNDTAKRTKFILKLKPANVILLSGTPTNGKYENLYSQCTLLGWNITKNLFWNQYIITEKQEVQNGLIIQKVVGYKNVNRLKRKLAEHGAVFMTSEDATLDLPLANDVFIKMNVTPEYNLFMKNSIVSVEDVQLVGDTSLTKLLYARMLCTFYNKMKLQAFKDLLQSSEDRIIVFYNFTNELYALEDICFELDKPTSIVNGKTKDLACYDEYENSVTFIQYQAGSMGLNLQKSNKIIYFSLPLSSELFEQSKARTRRIGQNRHCFYYYLICKKSVEEKIFETLQMRKDYTDELFKKGYENA